MCGSHPHMEIDLERSPARVKDQELSGVLGPERELVEDDVAIGAAARAPRSGIGPVADLALDEAMLLEDLERPADRAPIAEADLPREGLLLGPADVPMVRGPRAVVAVL